MDTVIVCGAGPVGLMTALGLARQGVDVTVLEQGPGVSPAPRANGYFPPTLALLERFGMLEEAKAIAYRSQEVNFRFKGSGGIVAFSLASLTGRAAHPYFLHLGQHRLGEIALRHLLMHPHARVRWNTEVIGFTQDAEGVMVKVRTPDGEDSLGAGWLVGADGARSAVRRLAGLEFEGFTWPDRYVATNVYYDFEKHGFAPNNMIHDPVNWAIVTRLGPEPFWRVTFGEDPDLPEDEVLRRVPERYKAILPGSDSYEIAAAAPYRVHERAASSFRSGRVLLAGDAAHALNPIGGMGFTTGAFDALSLSEALGAVLNGAADQTVLDDYAAERRRVFLEVSSPTARDHKRRVQEADPAQSFKDEQALRAVSENPEIMAEAMMSTFQVEGKPVLKGPRPDLGIDRLV